MRAAELHIENFRGVQCATLACGALTALVGRNGAGKSTFLHALDLFYRLNATVTLEDFTHRRTDGPLVIRVTFVDLRPDEVSEFSPYVHDGRLIVTRKFQPPGQGGTSTGQLFSARGVYARFSEVRSLPAIKKRTALGDLTKTLLDEGLVPTASSFRSEAEADNFMVQFEASHPGLLSIQESEFQFFGEKNVGGGKLLNYSQFVYIPAVRDAQQETASKGTSFSQLMDLVVHRKVNAMPQVAGLQEEVRKIVAAAFEPKEVLGSVETLQDDINMILQALVPTAALCLKWSGEPGFTIDTPKVLPSLTEDAFEGEIAKKGHGLQRALIFALLSHLARVKTVPAEANVAPTANGGSDASPPLYEPVARRGPDYIIGIEEPELYQHPNRCRHFANVLRRLAEETGTDGSATQILFATHSPYFVSLDHFGDVRVVRKDAINDHGFSCTSLTSQTIDAFRADWVNVCEKPPEEVTEASLSLRLQRTMTQFVNEGFFADIVVLVEGIGDIGVLTAVADQRKAGWLAKGVTVLSVDGKENLAAPILIFNALRIPTYFIFDGDKQNDGKGKKTEGQTTAANRGLLRLGRQTISDDFDGFPDDTVTDRFSCFAHRLEDRCHEDLGGDTYAAMAEKVADETGWKARDVLKSTGVAQRFVEAVYDDGKSLPSIERIVDAITAFAVSVTAHTPSSTSPVPPTPTP